MLTRLARRLYPALLQRDITHTEANLRRALAEADETIADLRQRIAQLEEDLETSRVGNRIHEEEIKKLAAVCARDLERVRHEKDVYTGVRHDEP